MVSGRARALLLSVSALCGALALAAMWFLRDDARSFDGTNHSAAGSKPPTSSLPDSVSSNAERTDAKKASERAAKEEAEAGDDPDAEFRGTGTVTLTVVDAASDAPLSDLPFLCWSERPQVHVYARGVTDAKGQAELANLPEDVVIFETGRRPPNANTIFATWLRNGSHREVTMRVGRGGRILGRVVDDLGHPLEGVEVTFDPRPGQESMAFSKSLIEESSVIAERFKRRRDLIAKSGPDGRFEADALLSRYSAIWIKHGAPDPRNELPIAVWLKWRQLRHDLQVKVEDGATSDVGDVAIPRSRIFAGHVVDKDGTPVAEALVSARWSRANMLRMRSADPLSAARRSELRELSDYDGFDGTAWPGEADFALGDEEALTANDGGFELDMTASGMVAVATRDGRFQTFQMPDGAPGTRTDGVELRLKNQTLLALDVTQDGGRAFEPRHQRDWIQVTAIAADGSEFGGESHSGGAGQFESRWYELPNDRIVALAVDLSGYERWRSPWHPPTSGREALAVDLVSRSRLPIKLRFELHDPKERASLRKRSIQAVACLLPPERALASKERARCGLDAEGWINFGPKADVDLAVANGREWHVYVYGPFVADSNQFEWIHAGAFVPGDERHEIELPPVSLSWVAEQARLEQEWQKKSGERISADWRLASVRVNAIDARSGAPIAKPHVSVRTSPDPNSWSGFSGDDSGGVFKIRVLSGHHAAKVGADGYRDSAEMEYTVEPGATADLGTVALEPMPHYAFDLVDVGGAPAAGRYSVSVYFSEVKRPLFGGVDARAVALDGSRFELRAELPDRFFLAVGQETDEKGVATRAAWTQRYELERWNPEETPKIVLHRWHATTLAVDLTAISADLRGAAFGLTLAREPAVGDRAPYSVSESHDAGADEHRYLLVLPTGRYLIRGGNGLFSIPDTPFELTDEQDDVSLKIAAR